MADVVFFVAGVMLGALVSANVAVIIANATHHEKIAKRVIAAASKVIWVFKLGGEDHTHRRNGANGHLRA
jgi:hypothetical protein